MKIDPEFQDLLDAMNKKEQPKNDLTMGVLAVSFICIPLLTVSTILWQWFG